MGTYAEDCAERYQFTRAAQDDYALRSLERAAAGAADEIVAVSVPGRKGATEVALDEQPRTARPDKIPTLRPAFRDGGTVTPANSSSISDGAAALIVMSDAAAEAGGHPVMGRIAGWSVHAQAPGWFTTAPVPAAQALLSKVGWAAEEVDLFEVNEAFAVVPMAFMAETGISPAKVNVRGGACALGHPIGASGARIIVTLLHAMADRGARRGLAAICIGGGEALALALESP